MHTPFPHWQDFTEYTPTMPKQYWDVYSQEQRIHDICKNWAKLVGFVDSMVDTINTQYEIIEELQEDLPDEVKTQVTTILNKWKTEGTLDPIIIAALAKIKKADTYEDVDDYGLAYVEED